MNVLMIMLGVLLKTVVTVAIVGIPIYLLWVLNLLTAYNETINDILDMFLNILLWILIWGLIAFHIVGLIFITLIVFS